MVTKLIISSAGYESSLGHRTNVRVSEFINKIISFVGSKNTF